MTASWPRRGRAVDDSATRSAAPRDAATTPSEPTSSDEARRRDEPSAAEAEARCASCGSDFKETARAGAPRAADPALLAAGEVRRRPRRRRPAAEHRAGRPGLLRDLRADRRHREVRPRAGDQVRDLRDQPDPRRDHRRAAGDRLDPALGPLQGPRGREGLRRARGRAAPHAHRGRGRRARWASRSTTCTQIFSQVSFVNVVALDELLNVGGEKGDKLSLVDTLEDTKAEDPVAGLRVRGDEVPAARRRSTRCPSGRRSSSRSTTTRASRSPRSARCSASPRAGSARCTPRPCCSCAASWPSSATEPGTAPADSS